MGSIGNGTGMAKGHGDRTGSGMCLPECFDVVELRAVNDKVETLWVRIRERANKADILEGVCYRPSNQVEVVDEAFY